jgi:hypothetical protein
MKNKTLLATLFLAATTSYSLQAQKIAAPSKFYVKVAGGYFFNAFPGEFPKVGPYEPHDERKEFNPGTGTTTVISEKVLTGSYGAGSRGGLSFGWNINQYIAVEAAFNYYHSKKNLMTREVTVMSGSAQELGHIESHGYVNAVDFAPAVVFHPGYATVDPYVRIGLVVPLWGELKISTDAAQTAQAVVGGSPVVTKTAIQREERVDPNVTVGFQGAFGVVFPVASKLDVFAEAEYRNIPVRSRKKEVTAYDETTNILNPTTGAVIATQHRGLADMSVAEKNTKYESTLDQQSNTPVGQTGAKVNYKDDNKPANDLKSYINIGGLGANLGLRYRF